MLARFTNNTWERYLAIEVPVGALDAQRLRERTLTFRYRDYARRYDEVEWHLDNRDGYLTDIAHIAAGLIIRFRLGYGDSATPWRSIIVNRLSGGFGVKAHEGRDAGGILGSPVRQKNGIIVYKGRNRNAPNLKKGPKEQSLHTFGKKRRFKGGSTSSITDYDLVINTPNTKEQVFQAKRLSDVVTEIAELSGYDDNYADIEETDDVIEGVTIPAGMSYGQWLTGAAARLGFYYKCDSSGFVFRRERSIKDKTEPRFVFDYGADAHVLDLGFKADFRLPVPSTATAKSYDPLLRRVVVADHSSDDAPITSATHALLTGIGRQFGGAGAAAQVLKNLEKHEIFCVPGGEMYASSAAQARFLSRHLNGLKFTLEVVGNPAILARDVICLKGTGSPLADRLWFVGMADHEILANTYTTKLDLELPPKKAEGNIYLYRANVGLARSFATVTFYRGQGPQLMDLKRGATKPAAKK